MGLSSHIIWTAEDLPWFTFTIAVTDGNIKSTLKCVDLIQTPDLGGNVPKN